ncbi:enoyl-CoA hydratase [Teredinibacter haidensis]|uniref:enoyl-CoA hydratase n=1 Tax=Teredinibacter haidensis TaxID=2731755 RepID=UPI000948D8D3|nr:enoyl-CoA hydratase [Teredinibacter haidensis]
MVNEILTLCENGVLEITFNRPEKKNALNQHMYQALADAFQRAANDPSIRVVLIKGAGADFCSGNDLADFSSVMAEPEKLAQQDSPIPAFMAALAEFPKPVVAAVHGVAVGIGVTLLLHCDLVYASEYTAFSLPFVSLGLRPEYASSYLLPRLAGHARAAEWLLLGEPFGADDARMAGMINKIVANPVEVAREVCEKLSKQPSVAVQQTKTLLKQADTLNVQVSMQNELKSFIEGLSSAEFREAVTAFFEKRPADFSKL